MKFFEIFKATVKQYFVYRVNFLLWRFRMVVNLLIIYFLWMAVFDKNSTVFSYDKPTMISYILLTAITSNLVLSSRTADIAGEIIRGDLVNYLLKPINFFVYQGAKDLADKLINLFFVTVEVSLVFYFLKPLIYVQTNLISYFLFIAFLVIGCLISYFINLSLSFIGFWSVEVWAPRFIFYIIVSFFSGSYFPLDILPQPIYLFLMATPFPYLYYLPVKVYLGLPSYLIVIFFMVSIIWLYLTYYIAFRVWQSGIKSFSFYGR